MSEGGFHFGQWHDHPSFKWCGRCGMTMARHTHLNSRRTDREARLQVLYTGFKA
ncbi:MAG: hypothetical protein WCB19_02260 [Thermoplasmata archaeon]